MRRWKLGRGSRFRNCLILSVLFELALAGLGRYPAAANYLKEQLKTGVYQVIQTSDLSDWTLEKPEDKSFVGIRLELKEGKLVFYRENQGAVSEEP